MTYAGAVQAAESRALLGTALESLQRDPNIPSDVLTIAGNIAAAIGALFEAEKASSELDGRACVKHAMGSLSQTMALLQDLKVEHEGIATTTAALARVMSQLYRLVQSRASQPDAPKPARVAEGAKPVAEGAKPAAQGAKPVGAAHAPSAAAAARAKLAAKPSSSGPRHKLEANVGATTESNFFVGFSGEIADGGVFIATYATFPVGTGVEVLVTLPGDYQFSVKGAVRFVRDPMDMDSEPGIGIGFEELPHEQRELILRFVRKRSPVFYDE